MTDDAGLKLLAAIESLAGEVRSMREAMESERESRETLRDLKEKKAAYQKTWRVNSTKRVSRESTESVSGESTIAVVKDLRSKQRDQDQETTARVESPKTLPGKTKPTRAAFAEAYRGRYGVEPVWNKKVNGQMAQVVERLGADEAPKVAAFYLKHNHAKYTGNRHPVGMLLQDCEGLRTQWATGKSSTATEARQKDQTAANMDGWLDHMSPEGRDALVGK